MSNSQDHHSRPLAIAPFGNGQLTSLPEEEPTQSFTCLPCARRKVKCDKNGPPCATCRKTKAQCEYQTPPPRKRKRKPEDDVHERLQQYEKLLKEHNLLPRSDNAGSERRVSHDAASHDAKTEFDVPRKTGRLLTGKNKTRFVDSNLWKVLGAEALEQSSEEEYDNEPEDADGYVATPALDPLSAAFLSAGSPCQNLVGLHPTYVDAMQLWRVFVDRVDPIAKVIHKPSTLAMLQRAAANPSSAPKPDECLLFSIYHLAVMALTDHECMELLGQSRAPLQVKYRDALRHALVNAGFLKSIDIAVLQAFVLFLISVRTRYEPHTFWILTGVAIRIAQRMGLHRDGEQLGLSPFDVEVHRRCFWQLIPLDGYAGIFSGTGIHISADSWDTKQPLNINDEDIWPDMKEAPRERDGATDMMFSLARATIGTLHRNFKAVLGIWGGMSSAADVAWLKELESTIDDIESTIQDKFLRYCDVATHPSHFLVSIMARASISVARLRVRLPRVRSGAVGEVERREIYDLATRVMDYDIAAQNNPVMDRFKWHVTSSFVWDALIWTVDQLQKGSPTGETSTAWSKIDALYACHDELLPPKRALPVAVGKATLRAWDGMDPAERHRVTEPSFIQPLRAALEKRVAGRQSIQTSPAAYNPFQPAQDGNSDLPSLDFGSAFSMSGEGTADLMSDLNADSFDWTFWDQLMKEPDSLSFRIG